MSPEPPADGQVDAIGFPWYRAEDFEELREICTDGHKLHLTYAGWRAAAEQGEAQLHARGARVVRAVIDPTTFRAWCRARGLAMDSKVRQEFAAEVARDAVRATRGREEPESGGAGGG